MSQTIQVSDYVLEIDRINSRLKSNKRIKGKRSFNSEFNMLISTPEGQLTDRQLALRDIAFDEFASSRPQVRQEPIDERVKQSREVVITKEFPVSGRQKGRIVRARQDVVTVRGVKKVIFRGRKGRFVKKL